MLWTPGNSFHWASDNLGTVYTDTGLGTSLTSGAGAHTKNGPPTSILAATAEDVYGIAIGFCGGATSGASRRFLTDLYIDPAGGSSWESTPRIANIASNSPNLIAGGVWYYFPLYVKAGASFGAACQAESTSVSQRILIKVFGKPTRPDLLRVGTRVKTYGATTASTTGTAFTPGTTAMGSYSASLATTADDIWWWQFGMLINDTTQDARFYMCDVAAGDATNKEIVMEGLQHINAGTVEQAGRPNPIGFRWPARDVPSGSEVYVRGACNSVPDSNVSGIVYGVAG